VGSRSKIDLAYIAGFLDGDGSLMLQIKRRKDGKKKWRFMATICFYQDSRHGEPLKWIKKILGIGYLSKRNDGMTELRINGFKQILDILKDINPFLKFKKNQGKAMYSAANILSKGALNKKQLGKLVDYIIDIQNDNYITKKKRTKEELLKVLDLTP
jgi:hypothetical protein